MVTRLCKHTHISVNNLMDSNVYDVDCKEKITFQKLSADSFSGKIEVPKLLKF